MDTLQRMCSLVVFFRLVITVVVCGALLSIIPGALPPSALACQNAIVVQNALDSGAGSLRQAVADVCDGGTITFNNNMTITLASEISITKSVTIDGSGLDIEISGNHLTRLFYINSINDTITFSHLDFTNATNSVGNLQGGAIGIMGGDVNISFSAFYGNAAGYGGAVYANSMLNALVITHSTFLNNYGTLSGGGIYNLGYLTVSNSFFQNNGAVYHGSAIYSSKSLTLHNSTFYHNTTSNAVSIMGTLNIQNSTIYKNQAGGIRFTGGTTYAVVNNSVVMGNLIGETKSNCLGDYKTAVTGANNLADDDTCGDSYTQISSLLAGQLGLYGGSTFTLPLRPGSPAIGAGANCLSTDQRGASRAGSCDIGAFQTQGFTLTKTEGDGQSALCNNAFASPLTVNVTANRAGDPVNGGMITFTAPAHGTSAAVSSSPVTITDGIASVTATANGTPGRYVVTASASGAAPVQFSLTNTGKTYLPMVSR